MNMTRVKNNKRLIIMLRWMIFVIILFLFLYSEGKDSLRNFVLIEFLVAVYALSNAALGFVSPVKLGNHATRNFIFLFDTLFVSLLIYLARGADLELYMVYFLVIFMAAIGQSLALSLVITSIISGLYILILARVNGIANVFSDTAILIRFPFLFGVALFSGYFSGEAKKYRERSEKVEELYREVRYQLLQSAKLASVGMLASGVAHEIGNLLQIIMGSAESIKNTAGIAPENSRKLKDIVDVSQQCGQITRGLLTFARQENVQAYEAADLRGLVDESCELVKYSLDKSNVRVAKKYEEAGCTVACNKNQVKQVIINFIYNAKDAMKGGGTVTVACRGDGENVYLDFTDEGEGIPADIQGRIFSPFFTTKKKGEGTGLGLSVSRDIIKEHGGEVTFKSAEGRGTTFSARFPRMREKSGQ